MFDPKWTTKSTRIFIEKTIKNFKIELRGDNNEVSIDSRKFGLVPHTYIKGLVEGVVKEGNWDRHINRRIKEAWEKFFGSRKTP